MIEMDITDSPAHQKPKRASMFASRRCIFLVVLVAEMALCASPVTAAGLVWDLLHQEASVSASDSAATLHYICKNVTNLPIVIESVRVSCGCISATSDPDVLLPGDCGCVTAVIDVGKQAGVRQVELSLQTDEVHVYRLSAQIVAPIVGHFVPTELRWEIGAERTVQKICFLPPENHSINLDHIDFDGGTISATVLDGSPEKGFTIEVFPLSTDIQAFGRLFVFASARQGDPVKMHQTKILIVPQATLSDLKQDHANLSLSPRHVVSPRSPQRGNSAVPIVAGTFHWQFMLAPILIFSLLIFGVVLSRRHAVGQSRAIGSHRLRSGFVSLAIVVVACALTNPFFFSKDVQTSVVRNDTAKILPENIETEKRSRQASVSTVETMMRSDKLTSSGHQFARLVTSERAFNFQEMKGFGFVRHRFLLKNDGDTDLRVAVISSSSGQLTAILSDSIIAPGSEGAVNVNLALTGQTGPQNHSILLETNDPMFATVALHIFGNAVSRETH